MFKQIKRKIEKELLNFAKNIDKTYLLGRISLLLSKKIKKFILMPGKRARPILFVIGYLGFAKKEVPDLYKSALSMELLHDFLLVHDDIIDKSDTRRGGPSMHKMFNNYLLNFKGIRFNGQDLSIIAGDIIYGMAIEALISIKTNQKLKEKALKKFIASSVYTAGGEFIELLFGTKDIGKITKQDIYKIYNFKTAYYTFAFPLSIGAILAGANQKEIAIISQYGLYLGKAFQIKDDLIGLFCEEKETGKSPLDDLKEAKKTILIWQAYNHSHHKEKLMIRKILSKNKPATSDLEKMRKIVIASGSRKFAENEITSLLKKARRIIEVSGMLPQYKNCLYEYAKQILN